MLKSKTDFKDSPKKLKPKPPLKMKLHTYWITILQLKIRFFNWNPVMFFISSKSAIASWGFRKIVSMMERIDSLFVSQRQ